MGDSKKYKIFVINMPGSDERWANISAQLNRLGAPYERVDGVDARKLGANEISKYYSFEKNRKIFPKPLRIGEIGCYIAHVNCWEKIVNQNIDFGVVLEDDIDLSNKFPAALQFLQKNFSDWNYVRLNCENKARLLYQKKDYYEFQFHEYIRTSGGFFAYVLDINTAEKLLKNVLPFACPADSNLHLYYKYGIDILSLIPPVVFEKKYNDSEIDSIEHRGRVRNFYPFARQVFEVKSYVGKLNELYRRDGYKFVQRILSLRQIERYRFR